MESSKPLIAIVGRPNVGKSTLFNRLVGSRRAITSDLSGTTRDRLYADADWQGRTFTLVDTGGLVENAKRDTMAAAVRAQAVEAIGEADLVLLVIDVVAGLTGEDKEAAGLLRRSGKPVLVVGNKADNAKREQETSELWELGLGAPNVVSALHGRGTGNLLDRLTQMATDFTKSPQLASDVTTPRVAIIGRPNVGKSTLVNRLANQGRVITSQEPGTTRDVASTTVETPAGPLTILDTAGVVRRGKAGKGIAKYSLLRTIRAINEADVVGVVIDGEEGPTVGDARVTSYVLEAGKAIVLVVNKWDLVTKGPEVQEQWFAKLQSQFAFLPSPPVIFLSAKTGEKVDRLSRAVYDVWRVASTEVATSRLNRVLQESAAAMPGGSRQGAPKLFYATQVGTRPPTFLCFVNATTAWPDSRRRQLVNVLRETFHLEGTPIRLVFRKRLPKEKVSS